jgi:hypothetical protein
MKGICIHIFRSIPCGFVEVCIAEYSVAIYPEDPVRIHFLFNVFQEPAIVDSFSYKALVTPG